MKRVDYLNTLGVVTVLLIAEIKDTQDDIMTTKSVALGGAMRLFFSLSYYCFFASIVISLVSSLTALHTGTAARVLVASILTFAGLTIYFVLLAMHDYAQYNDMYTDSDYHDKDNDLSTSKEEYMHLLYVMSIVPFVLCVVFLVPGSIYISYQHFVDRSNYKKLGVVFDEREILEFAKPLSKDGLPEEIGFRVYEKMLEAFQSTTKSGEGNPYQAARRAARDMIVKDPDRLYERLSNKASNDGTEMVSFQRPSLSFSSFSM